MREQKQVEELQVLSERLRPLYARLTEHRLYAAMETIEDLHLFGSLE